MADRITLDISILQGIFGDLTKLQQQLVGVSGGAVALDNATSAAFADVQKGIRNVTSAVGGLENAFDSGMRNVVNDIMAPVAKAQELEGKLRSLGEQVRTSKSVGEIVKLKKEITATQRELDGVNPGGMERKVGGAVSRMRSMFGGLVGPIAGAFAVGGVVGFTQGVVQAVAGAENFNASMKVMLGGQEEAARMSKELREFAVATPFDVPGLRQYTTQLIAYGTAGKNIIPTLDVLGNIAAGVGSDKLPQLVTAYGQVQAAGKLTGGELKQFTEAGVPLLDELAKITGKKTSDMAGKIAELSIPFETVRQALANMTGEGGKFYNLMAAQADTVGGQLNAAGETWGAFLEDIGTALLPHITKAIELFSRALDGVRDGFFWVMENSETILSVLKGIGIAVGIYAAALLVNNATLLANNALQAIAAVRMGAMAVVTNLVSAATTLWTGAQWLLNAALTANPIGVVVMAIAALIAGIVIAYNSSERFRGIVHGVWAVLKATWEWVSSYVGPVIDRIVAGFRLWWSAMKVGVQAVGEFFTGLWNWIVGIKDRAVEAFGGLLDIILAPFRAALDALSMIPGVDKIIAKVREVGGKVGAAFTEGQAGALASAAPGLTGPGVMGSVQAGGQNMGASSLVGGATGKGKGDGVTVGGGSGSGRTITMTITMNNAFNLPKDGNLGAREAAERVVAALVGKLNDAQFAMG